MILRFTTKRDTNGNRYTLDIDTDNKLFSYGYNTAHYYGEHITITKAERKRMIGELIADDFASVDRL